MNSPRPPLRRVAARGRRLVCLVVLLPVLVGAILLSFATDPSPLVSRDGTISPRLIAEARRVFAGNDPRWLRPGDERTAVIPAALIDAAVEHWASRRLGGGAAFVLAEDTAEIQLSLPAPGLPGTRYLNLRVVLQEADAGEPKIASASIGSLAVPAAVAEFAMNSTIRMAGLAQELQVARQVIRRLTFEPARGTVNVTYVWDPKLLNRLRSLAFPAEEMILIEAAQKALAGLLDHYSTRARVPLARILPPLLTCCGDETPQYSRAALLVLAGYLAQHPLELLLPEATHWPRPRRLTLTLLGREDSAQHFSISAALAAWAGEPAANAIGMYKEIEDSRAGSGFSFVDLAADRAGTRFGELLLSSSPEVHAALRATLTDADLLAYPRGLPEHLSDAVFRRRFGDGDTSEYRELTSEIERSLSALPLYR